jgi:sporulation protein YqfC
MSIFEKIRDFVDNTDIEIHILKNRVYVANYTEISDFNSNKIQIKHKDGIMDIIGKDLVIAKLVNYELLVSGEIKNIELR